VSPENATEVDEADEVVAADRADGKEENILVFLLPFQPAANIPVITRSGRGRVVQAHEVGVLIPASYHRDVVPGEGGQAQVFTGEQGR
jgi:hypothetical protein